MWASGDEGACLTGVMWVGLAVMLEPGLRRYGSGEGLPWVAARSHDGHMIWCACVRVGHTVSGEHVVVYL